MSDLAVIVVFSVVAGIVLGAAWATVEFCSALITWALRRLRERR